jgi:hypothetical protein
VYKRQDPDRPAPVKPATVQADATPAAAVPKRRRAAARAPGSEDDALVEAGVLPPDFTQPKPKRKRTGGSPKKSAAKSVVRKAPKISAKAPAKLTASKPVAKKAAPKKPVAGARKPR